MHCQNTSPLFFGRPRWTLVHPLDVPPLIVPGWSLGGFGVKGRQLMAEYVMRDPRRGDTGMVFGPELPVCAFCGHAGATDTYREDLYPDAPCCADEHDCYRRMVAS